MLSMFFGFSGRINRGQWWMVQLTTLVVGFGLNFLMADVTTELQQIAKVDKPDPQEAMAALSKTGGLVFVLFGWLIAAQWIFISSSIQRLHDRNSSGWRILFAYAPLVLLGLAVYFVVVPQAWTAAGLAAIMAVGGFAISSVWMTIEFGILPGDDFENDFGEPSAAGGSSLDRELAVLRGDDTPAGASVAPPAMARAATPNLFRPASGPATFGRR